MQKKIVIALCTLIVSVKLAFAGMLTATVDRQKVAANEPVILSIKVPASRSGLQRPDLTSLQNDFSILGMASSSNTRIVNGQISSNQQWDIKLLPRKTGKVSIPSIAIGADTTSPIWLTVDATSAPQNNASQQSDVAFMQASIGKGRPYVNSQVVYDVKIYISTPILSANMQPPMVDGLPLTRLGQSQRYNKIINGKQYVVIEQKYSWEPKQAGRQTIQAPILQLVFMDRDNYGMMGMGAPKQLNVAAKNIIVNVASVPGSASNGLPAQSLSLSQNWSTDRWQVGEPVTRTITLKAVGVAANKLPKLAMTSNAFWNAYPGKPDVQTSMSDQGVVTTLKQKVVLIPSQAGATTIPEIRIPWFDTKTGNQNVASLAARSINILAAAGQAAPATQSPTTPAAITPPPAQTVDQANKPEPVKAKPNMAITHAATALSKAKAWVLHYWYWLLAALLVCLLALAALMFFKRPRKASEPVVGSEASHDRKALKQAWQQVVVACEADDAKQAKTALLIWAKQYWPSQNVNRVLQIASLLASSELRSQLIALESSLYGKDSQMWQAGKALLVALQQALATQEKNEASDAGLPPLYPH